MPLYIAKKATSKTDRLNLHGAPEEIRTPGLQVRSLLLYPAELRARREGVLIEKRTVCQCSCGKKMIFLKRTPGPGHRALSCGTALPLKPY